MAEYINREDVREMMRMEFDDEYADEAVDRLPAAEVEPVRHGRWDDSGRYQFMGGGTAVRCSECGCALTTDEYRVNRWDYCPVCGARMDLGGAENA